MASIANSIVQRNFVKGERLVSLNDSPDSMFVVRQGRVLSEGKLVGIGGLVGEDMLYFAVDRAMPTIRVRDDNYGKKEGQGGDNLFDEATLTPL